MTKRKKQPTIAKRIIGGLEELLETLQSGAAIEKKFTVRHVELHLHPSQYDADMVKKTRQSLEASQAVFAKFLGVSVRTVRSWEQGINIPSDIACRFMDEIQSDPAHWTARLRAAIVPKNIGA